MASLVTQPDGDARRQLTVSVLAQEKIAVTDKERADMLAQGRQMEMDGLGTHALGFLPNAANRIRSGLSPTHRRYHEADPLLHCHDPLQCQLQLDITFCHKPSRA